jgi:hypothetical protein
MNFTDHGIPRDPLAEFGGDLACTSPLEPQSAQKVDALIIPGHGLSCG